MAPSTRFTTRMSPPTNATRDPSGDHLGPDALDGLVAATTKDPSATM